ncbi:MAG TPA: sensor domain-containing diguanylate cyclase [Syntrophaceae bacterium]|jgi:diguanylate cyclase (GGDEF)-like protein|nr:sensor domain-containing diguanylate cyclase [Syntrophaceae bacterium]
MNEEQDKDLSRENDKLMACLEVGKLLTSTLELTDILGLVMTKVSQLIDAQNWSLLLRNPLTGELTFEIAVGIHGNLIKGLRLDPGEGIAGYVAETGKPLFVANVQEDPRFSPKIDTLTAFRTESMVCLPLKIHGKVLGVIEIINVKNMERFEDQDYPVLSILGDYAAIAIENAQYLDRIELMGITDEYTGLRNARYLHQVLDELISQKPASNNACAVVFVDVDNFKKVVDSHGHLLGTQVLKEIGETISTCLAEKDILVKYGGDEYVIILPGRSKTAAVDLIHKILQALRTSTFLRSEPEPVRVTASFGIAVYPEDAQTKKDLLLLADHCMYDIKKATKDGIALMDPNGRARAIQ